MMSKGCAFEMKGDGKSRYFVSPEVMGLVDFTRFLYENRAGDTGAPLPIRKRIPQAEEISAATWRDIADHKIAGFSCFFILDIRENRLWVNEDIGEGLALYLFPYNAVIEASESDTSDIWERLLARFPHAKML